MVPSTTPALLPSLVPTKLLALPYLLVPKYHSPSHHLFSCP